MALTLGRGPLPARVPATLLLTVPLLASAPALAAEESDPFTVIAGYSVQRDSNLFRLADDSDPVIGNQARQRSDIKQVAQLGFDFEQRYSNQGLQLGAVASRNTYSEFDFLDFTALNYNARWNWQAGRWLGTLAANQSEGARSFADSLSTTRSVNTVRTYDASVDLRIRDEWRLGVGFGTLSSRYSDFAAAPLDFNQSSTDAHLALRTANDNELAFVARDTHGKSPNRVNTLIVDDEYDQRELRLDGRYRLAGRSVLSGYGGFARRHYPDTPFRDYSGVIGRLSYELTLSPKLRGELRLRRELGAKEDLVDTYVVTTAAAISVDFEVSSKITATVLREAQRRDFKGDPGLSMLASDGKRDGQASYGAILTYAPLRSLLIDLAYRRDARTDQSFAADFHNSTASLGVRLRL